MPCMKNDIAIVIFTKNPELGKVKTRLIPELGRRNAYNLYCELLQHTLNTVTKLKNIDTYIFTTPSINHRFFNTYKNNLSISFQLQKGDDLGERMHNAFIEMLAKYKMVILVGCDCAEISVSVLTNAVAALENNDVVIGPSNDGGYYLIGLKKANLNLFNSIEWGTSTVFNKTVERIKKDNLSCYKTEKLIDIDEYDDLKKLDHIEWINQYLD